MLTTYCLRRTGRCLLASTSRSILPVFFSSKSGEVQTKTDATTKNEPGLYNTSNADRKEITQSTKIEKAEPVTPNDLLEAKRLGQQKQNDKASSNVRIDASTTETKSASFNRSLANEGENLKKVEQIPSSGFSAFLRGISSGLPFFPSSKSKSVPVDIATTREFFIPLTRPSIIRLIANDSQFIDDVDEHNLFHELCHGFDSAVVQHYRPILNDLKHLFNPLNPDNETIDSRRVSYRDRLDNEYWLLQKIDGLLRRANFTELPRDILLDKFILHKDALLSSSELNVKIDGYDYDVLKFWILGREKMIIDEVSWWKKFLRKSSQNVSTDYFKRVVIAIRVKGHDRLYLKAFRDVPLQSLTQLLPAGKLQTGNFDQQLTRLSLLVGGSTLATHLLTTMADYHIPGLVIGGSSLTLLLGLWSLRNVHTSKISYLSKMNRLLFYKNVASNKQLLAMLIDRAQDELSKEVLLVYMFILASKRQNTIVTKKTLELEIENWIRSKTNTDISFNCDQSVEFLRKIGILMPDDASQPNSLQVFPYKEVVSILPKTSRILSEKNEEWDLVEGYDKKHFELDWKTVFNEEKLLTKGGWR